MKIETKLTIASSILVLAGCAHHERYVQSDQNDSTPGYVHNTIAYDHRPSGFNDYIATPSPSPSTTSTAQISIDQRPAPGTSITTAGAPAESDQTVILKVRQALNNNPNLTEVVPNIQVTGTGGAITLIGTVPNEQQKQAVETLARSTTGVLNVNNQLQVSLSPTSLKSSEEATRIYSTSTNQGQSVPPPAVDSSLSISNSSAPGVTPTSDRPNQEPRLYSTNETGAGTSPQSSINGGQSQSSLSVGTTPEATDSRQLNPGTSSDNGTNNPAQTETKDLSAATSATTSIYSNGQSSASSATVQPGTTVTENKGLSPTANSGSQNRLYSTSPTNANPATPSPGSPKDADRAP